jgi:hypothetical protein
MRSRYLLAALIVAGMALLTSLPSPADEAPSKDKIAKLIEKMGSGTFTEREAATKELAAIGVPALEALRQAVKSDDPEVRKRAEEIIPKIEIQVESKRVLTPKRVHLVYKDTPLSEALADFQKQSGATIQLHDPQGKLKERKITLDTEKTTFWRALTLFCDQAELSEASREDLIQMRQPPAVPAGNAAPAPGGPPAARPALALPVRILSQGQIILKDGKAKQLPTDDRSAVRCRALSKADLFGKAPQGEVIVPLEVSAEPRLQWQSTQSVRIDKAVDDQDQKLTQVIPQVEGVANGLPGGGVMVARGMPQARMWDPIHQLVPVQLKRGDKAAKALQELRGVVTAQLLAEARPMIIADKLDKAAGKVFKGDIGGSIKVLEVKAEEKQTTIRLELEQPSLDKVVPAAPDSMPGLGIRPAPRLPRVGAKVAPAPAAPPGGLAAQPPAPPPAPAPQPGVQIQIGAGGGVIANGGPMRVAGAIINGLSIQDDKDRALPIQLQQTQFRVVQGNGGRIPTPIYTLVCQHDKDKGQPAKVVYLGRKRVTVEIPFTLKDVPLP